MSMRLATVSAIRRNVEERDCYGLFLLMLHGNPGDLTIYMYNLTDTGTTLRHASNNPGNYYSTTKWLLRDHDAILAPPLLAGLLHEAHAPVVPTLTLRDDCLLVVGR